MAPSTTPVAQALERMKTGIKGRLDGAYQKEGVKWMVERELEEGVVHGGILADDMGLGKGPGAGGGAAPWEARRADSEGTIVPELCSVSRVKRSVCVPHIAIHTCHPSPLFFESALSYPREHAHEHHLHTPF